MKTKICIAGRLALIFGVLSLAGCDIFFHDAYNLFHRGDSEDGGGLPPLPMVLVPAGRFQRDDTSANISVITKSFYMSRYPVTRTLYKAVMRIDPSRTEFSTGMNDPVQWLSWYDALEFCNRLSRYMGKTPAYNISGQVYDNGRITSATVSLTSGNGYRLPTEMEWMWAAMGANSIPTDMDTSSPPVNVKGYKKEFAGDNPNTNGDVPDEFAWYTGNAMGITHPVGLKQHNGLGLYDMSGNVQEWCWDRRNGNDSYPPDTLSDYEGIGVGSGDVWVRRGGGSFDGANICTVANRSNGEFWEAGTGFRVVCPVPVEE
jgi:formylglycine-generating enzyme required for sulfatase activity